MHWRLKNTRTETVVDNVETRCLLAVVDHHQRVGRVTVRDVAEQVGCALAEAHRHLERLRSRGLVTWERGKAGTLRPSCEVVAVG